MRQLTVVIYIVAGEGEDVTAVEEGEAPPARPESLSKGEQSHLVVWSVAAFPQE